MTEWTGEAVAERLSEAAETARRLPPVRVHGYFSVWPAFVREQWEALSGSDRGYRPQPPSPATIDRMMEAMRWVQWLEEDQRHLVLMRARQAPWKEITRRFACDRSTAWRHWNKSLAIIAAHLNDTSLPNFAKTSSIRP